MKALATALALAITGWLIHPAPAVQPAAAEEPRQAEERKILVMLRHPPAHYRSSARYGGGYGSQAAQKARRRIAERIARENGLRLVDGWPMPMIGIDCYVMVVPLSQSLDEAIARVSRLPGVAWSQRLNQFEALAAQPAKADPLFRVQPSASRWRLADLHSLATGRGVTVAVIDSKVEIAHPDLAGQFAAEQDFLPAASRRPEPHGTGIAGVIGAKPGNGIGIVGIAPGARLMALRACSDRRDGGRLVSRCDSLSLARALQYALQRDADIINMSLSGPPDRLLAALIGVGLGKGAAVVAAFDARRPEGGFPASAPGVIAVADEALPGAPKPVFLAPGKDIPTTQPGGKWYLVSGSSFAAAHVAGLLALYREERRAVPRPASIVRAPDGRIDACATLVRITRQCDCACAIRSESRPTRR